MLKTFLAEPEKFTWDKQKADRFTILLQAPASKEIFHDITSKGVSKTQGSIDSTATLIADVLGVPQYWIHFIFCNLGVKNNPLMGSKGFKVVGLCISFYLVYIVCGILSSSLVGNHNLVSEAVLGFSQKGGLWGV